MYALINNSYYETFYEKIKKLKNLSTKIWCENIVDIALLKKITLSKWVWLIYALTNHSFYETFYEKI